MAETPRAKRRASRACQKAETQSRILEAAAAVFGARGYERASVSAIASRAGVSRSAVFWHFGNKATLFREAFRRMLVPFAEELKGTARRLDSRERFFELFALYEQFVSNNRETIEAIMRWVIESRQLRDSLQKPLFALHDEFAADLRETLAELLGEPERARPLAAALMALLDGTLLLSLLDSNTAKRELRSEGARALADLALRENRSEAD